MKFTVPGIIITAILMGPPAFAQYGSPGNPATPGASVTKDDTWNVTTRVKKHVANHSKRNTWRATSSDTMARQQTPKRKRQALAVHQHREQALIRTKRRQNRDRSHVG